ncbi:MAG: N-methyl-L-tryptophan oxidase [Candidatus Dormibacteraeota bacterium]|nr:N-methyl-L-tryptophan oxidase [Candidatus Dormibacteraeota bacterium]
MSPNPPLAGLAGRAAEYDVAVVGLGIMGASALWRLAARGVRAVGLEQFEPGHDRGSSHGLSRIIRTAYFEGAGYVPLVREAFRLWRTLEAESGADLLTLTGALMLGPPTVPTVAGTLAAARSSGLEHEVLDAVELRRRFPNFRPAPGEVAVYEPGAGVLRPTEAVLAALQVAEALGATVLSGQAVTAIEETDMGARITTGETVLEAARVIIAAGPWLPFLLPRLAGAAQVERQVQVWWRLSDPSLWPPARTPVFMHESGGGVTHFGLPSQDGRTVKLGRHHGGLRGVHPDTVDRSIGDADLAPVRKFIGSQLRGLSDVVEHAGVCLYTNTPDGRFLVGAVPGSRRLSVIGGCSGHGFKFGPVLGEAAADLALAGRTEQPVEAFAPARFG